jgi:hypothetical protein
VVLLVVVLWSWANVGAMAEPKKAIMAPNEINVFIKRWGLQLNLCEPTSRNRFAWLHQM